MTCKCGSNPVFWRDQSIMLLSPLRLQDMEIFEQSDAPITQFTHLFDFIQ
jgi:hypothetical protein